MATNQGSYIKVQVLGIRCQRTGVIGQWLSFSPLFLQHPISIVINFHSHSLYYTLSFMNDRIRDFEKISAFAIKKYRYTFQYSFIFMSCPPPYISSHQTSHACQLLLPPEGRNFMENHHTDLILLNNIPSFYVETGSFTRLYWNEMKKECFMSRPSDSHLRGKITSPACKEIHNGFTWWI